MNAAIVVALVSAVGIIGSTAIQAWTTRSANNRADKAREDERQQDERRRREDREDAAKQRAEARAADEARVEVERQAAAENARQELDRAKKAERRAASAAFLGQAEKCYRLMRIAYAVGSDVSKAIAWRDWQELSHLLGLAIVTLGDDETYSALAFMGALEQATNDATYAEGMSTAEASLREFAELVRDNT